MCNSASPQWLVVFKLPKILTPCTNHRSVCCSRTFCVLWRPQQSYLQGQCDELKPFYTNWLDVGSELIRSITRDLPCLLFSTLVCCCFSPCIHHRVHVYTRYCYFRVMRYQIRRSRSLPSLLIWLLLLQGVSIALPPFWIFFTKRNNSAAGWDIITKFGTVVDMAVRNVRQHYFWPVPKSKMAAGRHLEKRKIAITRPPFEILSPNLARLQAWTVRNVPWCHFGLQQNQDQIPDGGRKISNGHVSAMVHPIHFMFGSRVNMIQTTIIKQQIFILKNCRFKYTCNDDKLTIVSDVENSKN